MMIFPLPPREREGARAPRGKGEGAGNGLSYDPGLTLTRPFGPPSPGTGEGFKAMKSQSAPTRSR